MTVKDELLAMGMSESEASRMEEFVFDSAAASTYSINSLMYAVRFLWHSKPVVVSVDVQAKLRELVSVQRDSSSKLQ